MKIKTYFGGARVTLQWCRGAVALVCVTLALGAHAQDYSEREEVAAILAEVGSAGVDVEWARGLLAGAKRQQSILDAIARPAEKTKPWHDYRDIFSDGPAHSARALFVLGVPMRRSWMR